MAIFGPILELKMSEIPKLDQVQQKEGFQVTQIVDAGFPTRLFKYRKFDEYSLDLLENKYLYLASVDSLDDPFECQVDFTYPLALGNDSRAIKTGVFKTTMEYVLDNFVSEENKPQYRRFIIDCMEKDGSFSRSKAIEICHQYCEKQANQEMIKIINEMPHLVELFDKKENQERTIKLVALAGKEREILGICSLSEVNDSEVMWSMYADNYRGYCVEYLCSDIDLTNGELFSVIYSDNRDNNIISIISNLYINCVAEAFSGGDMKSDKNQLIRTFLYKSKEWAFQKEWRIIGDSKTRCRVRKISAVYIGCKMPKEQEEKIIEISEKDGFPVYKVFFTEQDTKIHFKRM